MATKQESLQKRSIIILGKPGVGKATVANEILGERRFPVSSTVDGMTRALNPVKFEKKRDTEKGCLYEIYVVDVDKTSSLSEVGEQLLKDCKLDSVNLVLFVFKAGRFTNEEKELFDMILASIPKAAKISGLVVTNCEDLSTDARKTLIEDFKSNKHSGSIASKLKKGILTVGFPNLEGIKPALKEIYSEDVEKDRDELCTLIHEDCGLMLTYPEVFGIDQHEPRGLDNWIKYCNIL